MSSTFQQDTSAANLLAYMLVDRSGCPRNDLLRGGTFLAVQCLDPADSSWSDVATDNDWETHFHWERHWKLSTQSFATVR